MITVANCLIPHHVLGYWAFVQSAIPGRRARLMKRTTL